MVIINVPAEVAVSPQDGSSVKFYSNDRTFRDERGNEWSVDELARCRPGNAVKKWVRENFPETD